MYLLLQIWITPLHVRKVEIIDWNKKKRKWYNENTLSENVEYLEAEKWKNSVDCLVSALKCDYFYPSYLIQPSKLIKRNVKKQQQKSA